MRRAFICILALSLLSPAVAEAGFPLGAYSDVILEGKDKPPGEVIIRFYTASYIIGYQRGLFVGEARVVLQNNLSPQQMCMRTSALETEKVLNLFHQKIANLKTSDPGWREKDSNTVLESVINEQFACPKKVP